MIIDEEASKRCIYSTFLLGVILLSPVIAFNTFAMNEGKEQPQKQIAVTTEEVTIQCSLDDWIAQSPIPRRAYSLPYEDAVFAANAIPLQQQGLTALAVSQPVKPPVLSFEETASGQVSEEGAKIRYVSATAYSSTVDQTDASPCITASGFNVCEHGQENIVAANFLPIGAQIMVPDLYGDKVFIVQDRMNARYQNRVDFWMTSRGRALQFGVKRNLKIVIL